jgi:PAS domain S-box-containing protein
MAARILIVDDEAIIAETTALNLRQLGYAIAGHAASGAAALELAAREIPDLVLMDINLGNDHEGIVAAETIRRQYGVPVVYVTAYTDDDTLARAKITHPFGYVSKPFAARDLHVAIEIALHNHQLDQRLRQSEQALADRAEHFAALLATTRDGVLETDEQGRMLEVNQAYCELTGYARAELIGQPLSFVEARATSAPVAAHSQELLRLSGTHFECQHRAKDGRVIDLEISVTHLAARGRVVAFLRDITRRKEVQAAREAAEAVFRAVWEQSSMGMRLTDAAGDIRAVNDAYCRLVRWPREALVGQPFTCIYRADDVAEMQRRYQERFAQRAVQERTSRQMQLRDGRIIDFDVTSSFMELEHTVMLLVMFQDVTAQRRAEQALRESEQRFRGYFDSGLIGMCITSPTKGWVQCNDRLCAILGYSRPELMQKTWMELTHPEDLPADVAHFERVLAGEIDSYTMEKRFLHKDGQVVPAEIFARAVRQEGGRVDHFVAMVLDISLRKQAEAARAEMAQSLKFKNQELERLVYLTSHDLRSPMLNIQGFSHRIAGDCGTLRRLIETDPFSPEDRAAALEIVGHQLPRSFGFIQSGVEKMDRLIASLLRLSRLGRAAFEPKPLDLNAVVNEALNALAFSLQAAEGVVETGPLPACAGDAALVSQLFTNLIDNAIKYRCPGRGLRLAITGEVREGQAIYCVADNGVGIPPEHLERIWEVFFRADPAGAAAGDGLGLNLVRGIVERHGGKVWVESVPGEGSRFFVALPLVSTAIAGTG